MQQDESKYTREYQCLLFRAIHANESSSTHYEMSIADQLIYNIGNCMDNKTDLLSNSIY